jgi:hypothetical protein
MGRARGLLVVSAVAAVLMLIAAVNLVMVFALFSAYHQAGRPGTELPTFVLPMAVGAFPFLITAALIVWVSLGTRATSQAIAPRRQTAERLAVISGIALPFILVCGFWVGLFAAAQELPDGSPPAAALTVYQFTFLSAVIADLVTLVWAVVVIATGRQRQERPPG